MVGSGLQPKHDVDMVVKAITAKLHSKADVLELADASFVLEIYKKGTGYDVKLKTTM